VRGVWNKLFQRSSNPVEKPLRSVLYTIIRFRPGNFSLYELALRHRSVKTDKNDNERLEFLGDAVLSLIIGEYLFKKYPFKEEGFLTEIRARIVNRASLNKLAQKVGVDVLLYYDRRALRKETFRVAYGNALEALIGAIYLDKGYRRCRRFVLDQLLHLHVDLEALIQTDTNYKGQLITWASRNRKDIQFTIIDEQTTEQYKEFTAQVTIETQVMGQGKGNNKKQAEQQAAQAALATLLK